MHNEVSNHMLKDHRLKKKYGFMKAKTPKSYQSQIVDKIQSELVNPF